MRWFGHYLRKERKKLTGCPRAKIVFGSMLVMPNRIFVHSLYYILCTVSYFHICFFFLKCNFFFSRVPVYTKYMRSHIAQIISLNTYYIHILFIETFRHTKIVRGQKSWSGTFNFASAPREPRISLCVCVCLCVRAQIQIYILLAVMHFSQNAAYSTFFSIYFCFSFLASFCLQSWE